MKLAIDETRCKGCNLCTKVCPYRIFREGKRPNRRGIMVPELDRPERCACPDQAIHWVEEEPYEPRKVAIEY
jgi:2-oxoglutarate ferredoxin oxidoreductase subunit delta